MRLSVDSEVPIFGHRGRSVGHVGKGIIFGSACSAKETLPVLREFGFSIDSRNFT
ncbi:hypothetical protein THTE_3500 [Thermogutta terrifontis]|uniref:Uncharacterized protein n=1 Tax=Thermogutta terrifontis TaxID=1331910 RepID=A0A286RJL9_9BACT|nr:hypothetical protein THTE_3500 [Thermogutta terrifontis]